MCGEVEAGGRQAQLGGSGTVSQVSDASYHGPSSRSRCRRPTYAEHPNPIPRAGGYTRDALVRDGGADEQRGEPHARWERHSVADHNGQIRRRAAAKRLSSSTS